MDSPPSQPKSTSPDIRAFLDDVQEIQKSAPKSGKPPPFKLLEKLPKRVAYLRSVKARQARPARDVEIRILPAGTPPDLERLYQRELDDLVRLDHPAFLPVLMVGKIGGRHCYAVPLRTGTPLTEAVTDEGLGLAQRCAWIRSLAGGLAASHHLRFLVGNVRPELLLLDRATGALHFSHHVGHDPSWPRPAFTTDLLGDEIKKPSMATDVYYWALLAMWILTSGNLPATNPMPAAQTMVPELSDELAEVLDGCLAPSPQARPENGLYLVELLQVYSRNLRASEVPTESSAPASVPDMRSTLAEIRESGRLDENLLQQLRAEVPIAPAASPLSIDALLSTEERTGIHLEPKTLAACVVALAIVLGGLLGLATRRAPAAKGLRLTPAPAGSEAWIPKSRPDWEIKALPTSKQEEFKQDEGVRWLLATKSVDGKNFRETWSLVRSLVTRRKLPRPLDAWGRVQGIGESFAEDPEVGAKELEGFLTDLRTILEGT